MGVELPEDAIDRAHRIGKKYDVEIEEVDGKVCKVCTISFERPEASP